MSDKEDGDRQFVVVRGGVAEEPRRWQRHRRLACREKRWRERRTLRCPSAGAAGAGWAPGRRRTRRSSAGRWIEEVQPAAVWRGAWSVRGEPKPPRRSLRKRIKGGDWCRQRWLRQETTRSARFRRCASPSEKARAYSRVLEGLEVLRDIGVRYLGPRDPNGGTGEPPRAMWEEMEERLPQYTFWAQDADGEDPDGDGPAPPWVPAA